METPETTDQTTKIYTVVGIYEDNEQRYAEAIDASSPGEAEQLVTDGRAEKGLWLIVAGVIEGRHEMVG